MPQKARKLAQHRLIAPRIAKKEVWDYFWTINVLKVRILLLHLRTSINKNDRELLRRIEEAWGA